MAENYYKAIDCYTVSSSYAKHLMSEIPNHLDWKVHHNIVSTPLLIQLFRVENKNFIFLSIARLHKVKI